MAIMIRVAKLMARCFWFFWEFVGFLYFLDCPPRILSGFTWRLQKEPPISNSKMPTSMVSTKDTYQSLRLESISLLRGKKKQDSGF